MSRHQTHRPVPAKRIFASLSEPHYPTRESDGPAYVGVMYETAQLRVYQARQDALRYLALASITRSDGGMWARYMRCAEQARATFAGLKRSGGRVDWRGRPVEALS